MPYGPPWHSGSIWISTDRRFQSDFLRKTQYDRAWLAFDSYRSDHRCHRDGYGAGSLPSAKRSSVNQRKLCLRCHEAPSVRDVSFNDIAGTRVLSHSASDHKQFDSQSRTRHAFSECVFDALVFIATKQNAPTFSGGRARRHLKGCVVLTIYHI